ncbi:SDR family oxidoreductase [Mycobacterium paraseoulense]|uniref:Short-chain dehydrogenase n=1 Tax=Mycobacterium paraseoulense TaxID=590652 RepID=A0A1X0I891_9MYCO|nr:SDR family oxidoreductase [Mycobacterium paraseoulense]MCV7397087.1 SDR family oxidoreductase [Mycobacterium paraseoulense]ORB38781.1 short-chain dehydrogenase [Mycobacterium paraseoulense]BBZ69682.1 short-chain dehydrogenase [Mycobacterium paraseoulense]
MKSVFITGAGSGMGREGAKLFHAKGWRVGAVDRNAEGLTTLQQELGGERLWTRQVDVTDRAALEGALADFCADDRGLDMMWNNAGIGESGWFEDVPYEAAMRVVDINYKAVLTGAYASLPYLKKAPGSLMFSTSSSSATYGMPRLAVYSSTKHAVKGLTEALSVEWQRHGVRVADVLPGLIDTAILTTTTNHSDGGTPMTAAELRAAAPKKGMLRLMPASSVAETAWQAYHNPKRLHWYVPRGIRLIDLFKGLSPEFVRRSIVKSLPALMPKRQ